MRSDDFIKAKLLGRLWHVTSAERFERILADGLVRPEPDLPDRERWSTSQGPEWFPFVRHIGGFSLFDFAADFDVSAYRSRCPSASLEEFIPFPKKWGSAIWLEIDQEEQAHSLLSGAKVWARCVLEGHGKRCMPYIEAAHLGDMPVSSIKAVYRISAGDDCWTSLLIGAGADQSV